MNNPLILLMRLEGPLQSWGEHSRWDYRDTADFPTKSAVVGLIACAMGINRNDPRIGELCESLKFAVRADRVGSIMTDFHTVRDEDFRTANGEQRPKNKRAIVSRRKYLQDASFLIAIEGSEDIILEIKKALDAPHWTIYLGRKSCVPSFPVIGVISSEYSSLLDALSQYPLCERHSKVIVAEFENFDSGEYARSDCRTSDTARSFRHRYVARKKLFDYTDKEKEYVSE